jgi:uncharacterized OB-fold protein
MSDLISISPAKYWRETRVWPQLLGQTGKVIAATEVQFGLPELNHSAPYWLLLVKHDNPKITPTLHLYLGADGHTYQTNDRVICVLKRFSSPGNGLIHYGIKVAPVSK